MTKIRVNLKSYLLGENEVDKLPGFHGPGGGPSRKELSDEEMAAEEDSGGTPIYIEGEREVLLKGLKKWFLLVAQEAWSVGGDDTFYDYYPDNFYVGQQLLEEFPELQPDYDLALNFAIAVTYGIDGMDDGLGIPGMHDEEAAIEMWSAIMGIKLFARAHELQDKISAFGGFFMHSWQPGVARWKKVDKARDYNKLAERMGLPPELYPYSKEYLKHFKENPE